MVAEVYVFGGLGFLIPHCVRNDRGEGIRGDKGRDVRDGGGCSGWQGKGIARVCLGWWCWERWIPAPAFAGVTFFRRNDGVALRRVVRQAHHERKRRCSLRTGRGGGDGVVALAGAGIGWLILVGGGGGCCRMGVRRGCGLGWLEGCAGGIGRAVCNWGWCAARMTLVC